LIHLHHQRDAKQLKIITISGISLCLKRNVPRKQLTAFVEDADCPECLAKAKAQDALPKKRPRPNLDDIPEVGEEWFKKAKLRLPPKK